MTSRRVAMSLSLGKRSTHDFKGQGASHFHLLFGFARDGRDGSRSAT